VAGPLTLKDIFARIVTAIDIREQMNSLSTTDLITVLQLGTIEVEGLLPWSSNYTFLLRICHELVPGEPVMVEAVYKPRRGERPLWDFPQGTLCQRERAAFLVSEVLGWALVPPTVLREGPHGFGSVQLFVDHDPEQHYFTFEGSRTLAPQLQRLALFDLIVNNADRKSGHVLLQETAEPDQPGRLWSIDHGICFHSDYKLRTVIWEFVGQPISETLLGDLSRLQQQLGDQLSPLRQQLAACLAEREIAAMTARVTRLLKTKLFPNPGPGRHYPWPPV
jgi:uncharacterized repeat protein (TIGR03843 family)